MSEPARNTVCIWYDTEAEQAANFYAATFPDSFVSGVFRAPSDFPSGKEGDVLTVEFTVLGIPCIGINGGTTFTQSEAFSFQVATRDQAETDRYWNAIVGNGGAESVCGWCKDKWGVVADHAGGVDEGHDGERQGGREARIRCDDADGEDRRGEDRGGGAGVSESGGERPWQLLPRPPSAISRFHDTLSSVYR